jgi:hypothetical protein
MSGSNVPSAPPASPGWETLGGTAPGALGDARLELHWAAQVIASVGETHVAHVSDTSHTSMQWDPAHRALVGLAAAGEKPFRAALRPEDLTLLLLDGKGAAAAALPLRGRAYDEALAWMRTAIAEQTRGGFDRALVHPGFEIPPHAVGDGARFRAEPASALSELGRWYANADAFLRELAARTEGAGPVLCWPHHFDIATLVTLEPGSDAETTRTIGIGLSPGDESYAEPYWYVNPWPVPETPNLPALPCGGHWHTEGWVGAVLTGTALTADGDARAQRAALARFADAAVAADRALLA